MGFVSLLFDFPGGKSLFKGVTIGVCARLLGICGDAGMRIQAIVIAFLTCTLVGAQDNTQMSRAARAYLEEALNYMQQNALNKKSINWPVLREETIGRAKDAKATSDTYPAIVYALTQLGERHSNFQTIHHRNGGSCLKRISREFLPGRNQ
jgi:hypothetical protein